MAMTLAVDMIIIERFKRCNSALASDSHNNLNQDRQLTSTSTPMSLPSSSQ
jgi:hypothetical protein